MLAIFVQPNLIDFTYLRCKSVFTPLNFFEPLSILFLNLLAIDRLYAVRNPLVYMASSNRHVIYYCIGIVCFVVVTVIVPSFLDNIPMLDSRVKCKGMAFEYSPGFLLYTRYYSLIFSMTSCGIFLYVLCVTMLDVKKLRAEQPTLNDDFIEAQKVLLSVVKWYILGNESVLLFYKTIDVLNNYIPVDIAFRLQKYNSYFYVWEKIYDSIITLMKSATIRNAVCAKV